MTSTIGLHLDESERSSRLFHLLVLSHVRPIHPSRAHTLKYRHAHSIRGRVVHTVNTTDRERSKLNGPCDKVKFII